MKIDRLDVAAFTVPTDQPEADGTLSWNATTVVVAQPSAGGVTGLGFTYATRACANFIADVLRPEVTGRNPCDVAAIWAAMVRAIRNMGRPGITSMSIAAVDIGLWDLKAKLLGLSLVDLLGPARDAAPVYGSGGFTSYDERTLSAQLTGWVQEGIPRVKMKIGSSSGTEAGRDLRRVAAARAAIGPSAELFVDANGAYTAKQAARLAPALADQGVTWFEEPVSSDDLAGLSTVRAHTTIDVAAGEYGYDLVYFERMSAAGAVDVLQADVSRCAGITEWLRVAAIAAAHGLEISGHCAPSLHAHPACSIANLRHLEYFHDHTRVDRILFDGVLDPSDGALHPDRSRPGLGLEIKHPDADPYRTA